MAESNSFSVFQNSAERYESFAMCLTVHPKGSAGLVSRFWKCFQIRRTVRSRVSSLITWIAELDKAVLEQAKHNTENVRPSINCK